MSSSRWTSWYYIIICKLNLILVVMLNSIIEYQAFLFKINKYKNYVILNFKKCLQMRSLSSEGNPVNECRFAFFPGENLLRVEPFRIRIIFGAVLKCQRSVKIPIGYFLILNLFHGNGIYIFVEFSSCKICLLISNR